MTSVKTILTDARGLIEKGWCQKAGKKWYGTHAEYCTVGALGSAVEDTIENWDDLNKAEIHLANTLFDGTDKSWEEWYAQRCEDGVPLYPITWASHMVINWNDTPGRTQAEILEGFDRAIETAGDD